MDQYIQSLGSDNIFPKFSLIDLSDEDQKLIKDTFSYYVDKAFKQLENKGLSYSMGFFDRK